VDVFLFDSDFGEGERKELVLEETYPSKERERKTRK